MNCRTGFCGDQEECVLGFIAVLHAPPSCRASPQDTRAGRGRNLELLSFREEGDRAVGSSTVRQDLGASGAPVLCGPKRNRAWWAKAWGPREAPRPLCVLRSWPGVSHMSRLPRPYSPGPNAGTLRSPGSLSQFMSVCVLFSPSQRFHPHCLLPSEMLGVVRIFRFVSRR